MKMKKATKVLIALILVFALVIPASATIAHNIGDTIVWTTGTDEWHDLFYYTYKGELETGGTWHGNLGTSDSAVFTFTADKTGYYLFDSGSQTNVSEDIVDGSPVGNKDSFDISYNEDFCVYYWCNAYYFEAGETQFVSIYNEEITDEETGEILERDNSGLIYITFAGEINDLEIVEKKTYLSEKNIWLYACYDEETESVKQDEYCGGLDDVISVSFTELDSEIYVDYAEITGTEELKDGENTVDLCLGNFKKQVTVNCFDIDNYITDISVNDNNIYVDYSGNWEYDPYFTVTFADGTTKTVYGYETFEINGIYFFIDRDICDYDGYSLDYYIRYGYSEDLEYEDYDCCYWDNQDINFVYKNNSQNFKILISDISCYTRWIFSDIANGWFSSVFYDIFNIFSSIRYYFESLI